MIMAMSFTMIAIICTTTTLSSPHQTQYVHSTKKLLLIFHKKYIIFFFFIHVSFPIPTFRYGDPSATTHSSIIYSNRSITFPKPKSFFFTQAFTATTFFPTPSRYGGTKNHLVYTFIVCCMCVH